MAVIIGGHQCFKNQANDNLSEIIKANVEALAGWDEPDPNQPEDFGTLYQSNLGNYCCCPGTGLCGSSKCDEGVCPKGN